MPKHGQSLRPYGFELCSRHKCREQQDSNSVDIVIMQDVGMEQGNGKQQVSNTKKVPGLNRG